MPTLTPSLVLKDGQPYMVFVSGTTVKMAQDPPADLVRKDPYFNSLGLDAADYTTKKAVIDLLLEHPRLMQRPLLVKADRVIIGRPVDRARELLES